MKKTLSLLLAVAMLASICTVPAWAEDEVIDIPVIEEITEEELIEEVELFGEVEMMAEGDIVEVTTSDDDGMTLLSDIDGVVVTYDDGENYEGYIPSIYNGKITVGDALGECFIKGSDGNEEGFMMSKGKSLTIDFGEKKSFTGIRLWESSRTRYFGTAASGKNAPGARRINLSDIYFSDDNETWYKIAQSTAVYNEEGHYSDLQFKFSSTGNININARYIKFYATSDMVGWGQVEIEEIAMLDAVTEANDRPTWSLDGKTIPTTAIESVVAGSVWNNSAGYSESKTWDNNLALNSYWHSWANDSNYDNDPARSLTIKLKETTEIGGIRLWPRNDGSYLSNNQNTASVRKIVLEGSLDGENWWTLIPETADLGSKYDAVKYSNYIDLVIPRENVNSKVNYVRMVGKRITAYVCLAEFQLLDASMKTPLTSAYNHMDDVLGFYGYPAVIGGGDDYDNNWRNATTDIASGVIYQTTNKTEGFDNPWTGANSGDPHMENNFVYFSKGYKAWVDIDLGYPTTFSAVRLFGRWNQPGQALSKGRILVSEDGVKWYTTELHTDNGTNVAAMTKYNSTNDVYTDMKINFGSDVNIEARYIRILCEATVGGDHWSWQQLMLVKPDAENDTLTVAQLAASYADKASAVDALISAIGEVTLDRGEAIKEARTAYDALHDNEKNLVENYATLTAAEAAYQTLRAGVLNEDIAKLSPETVTLDDSDAIAEMRAVYESADEEVQDSINIDGLVALETALANLTRTVKVNIMTASSLGDRIHSGKIGYETVPYTLYVSGNDVTVTGITWNDKEIANTYGEWADVNNGDGTLTLTLGGNYYRDPDWVGWLTDIVKNSVKAKDTTGYYYTTKAGGMDGYLLSTETMELTEDAFNGTFVREVTMSNIGDNIITVSLSDGTTKEINLVSEYTWVNIPATAKLGSNDTDAIAPSASWKVTTNLHASANGNSGKETALFDGVYDANIWSQTITAVHYTYDADGNATEKANNHILRTKSDAVWVDFGEPTDISGVRVYEATYNLNDVVIYGSNDLVSWDKLGENLNNSSKISTVLFEKTESYRYIKIQLVKFNNGTPSYTFLNEIAFLAPQTRLSSAAEVAVDASENMSASFDFNLIGGETVESLKDAENADVACTFKDSTLTIGNEYIAALADGAHTFTLTFTNGQTFTLKVTKSDTSKVSYLLFGANNSTNLVLANTSGKVVKAVTVVNGDASKEVMFTQSADKKTITVLRQIFRNSTDLYSLIDVASAGEVQVVVTYDDESAKTYAVTVDSAWVNVPESGRTATYAADEVVPGAWKARVSSAQNIDQPGNTLTKAPVGIKDQQNLHTYFGGIDPEGDGTSTTYGDSTAAIGHYFDIYLGENPEQYNGIRHLERAGGTTWNVNVTITAKNNAEDEWVEIYNALPTYTQVGTDVNGNPIRQADMLFKEAVTYRYVRIHIKSRSEHITIDNLKVLKDVAKLTSSATAVVDITEAEAANFVFYLPEGAAGAVSVKAGEAAVEEANFALDKETGILTFNADYVATLGASTALTVTIDGITFTLTITKEDKYTATYVITGGDNGRGTDDLVLNLPAGKTPVSVSYGEKTIQVNPDLEPVELVADVNTLTVKRYAFRNLDDFFDMSEVKLTVNFSDETTKEYTITLTKESLAVTGVNSEAFKDDEIIPGENKWNVTASASYSADTRVTRMLAIANPNANFNWHSAYTEVQINGDTQAKADATTSRFYVDVNFGEEQTFYGIRYYKRVNGTSGLWNGVSVYGKDASGNWTLIKSRAFNTEELAEDFVNVYFAEAVTYQEVRLVIDGSNLVTAKAVTFLNKIPAPVVPEEEVNVQVTPTTGGNVTVSGAPTQGDNFVPVNEDIIFTAAPDVTGEGVGFMYWVEANTGKILGTDTELTVKATSGKDIKAVFADPASFEVFVSFFGRNASSVIAHTYVKKGTVPTTPSEDKLYTTGYEFKGWATKADATEEEIIILGAVNENSSFYAVYEAKTTKGSRITVEGGTVRLSNNSDEAKEEATYAYDTPVKVTATVPAGEKFSHWEIGEEIVSYDNPYEFYAPDSNIAIKAVFVDEEETVEKKLNITMVETYDEINGIQVVSFLTTRYIPEGANVLETGVIYVKDTSLTGTGEKGILCIADIGKTSTSGKAVKIATATKDSDGTYKSGQYKLTASYAETGIKAVGFITYLEGGVVTTIYTGEIVVGGTSAN